jgi:hypothetical protein
MLRHPAGEVIAQQGAGGYSAKWPMLQSRKCGANKKGRPLRSGPVGCVYPVEVTAGPAQHAREGITGRFRTATGGLAGAPVVAGGAATGADLVRGHPLPQINAPPALRKYDRLRQRPSKTPGRWQAFPTTGSGCALIRVPALLFLAPT